MEESSGLRTHVRPFESGRGVSHHHRPRVAQLRRAPLLHRGGWGFESLTADTPSKLSSAEQPPCKRKAVGSIPTWGSSPPRSPTWQRHPAQNRTSRGSNPRGGTGGWGNPWFPHRPPPSGRTPPCAWSASRPAKPASGVTARTTWQGRPFRAAGASPRGVCHAAHSRDATSSNGRTSGCYPENAGSTPAVAVLSSVV